MPLQVFVPRDRSTGKGRGFAFVRFFELVDAEQAAAAENGKDFMGRTITAEIAKFSRPEVGTANPVRGA